MTRNEAADFLKTHDNFMLVTHIRPDGDTLGSAAALCSCLRRLGKRAFLYRNGGITAKYMRYVEPFLGDGRCETVVSVDVAAENLFPEGFRGRVDIAVDHHPSNSRFAKNLLLEPERAACGETVLALIKLLSGTVTREEADLLYIAVSTDTGCFRYANTNGDTMRAAAELLDAGADGAEIAKIFFRTASKARIALEGMVYSGLKTYEDGKISVAVITKTMIADAGAAEEDMDDVAALANRVEGVEAAVTVREMKEGKSRVSLRTSERIDAAKVCGVFGGGGHKMASGCTIQSSPEEAARLVVEELCKVLRA